MTENKEPKAEEKQVEKVEETPKWAIELSAKLDKMADAFLKYAEGKQDEAPAPAEAKEPSAEDCGPDEEWDAEAKMCKPKAKPPEAPAAKQEDSITEEKVAKMVEEGIKKALSTAPEKKSKVPTDPEVANVLTYEKIAKMSWEEVAELSKKMGSA